MQVCLGNKTKEEQRKNRLTLTAIFDCVRHCGKQGIALRGHGNEKKSGNIWNLLWLLGRYNTDINTHLNSESSTKYLSPDVQNKMLKILSQMILRKLIGTIKTESRFLPDLYANNVISSYVFSLIADEALNICNQEQVSICIRYCTNTLQSDKVFLGFYETCKTDSSTLFCLIKDGLMRLGLDISGLCGQGNDSSTNMAGKINGLQQKMLKENPKALYFHCIGHQPWFADPCTEYSQVSHTITCVNKIMTFVKESPKRCGWFAAIQASSAESTTVKLRPLRSTRWILRKDCIDAFLANYNNLMNFMEEINNDTSVSAAVRSSAFSHLLNLEKFDFYFILRLLQQLFGIINPIHVKCPSRQSTTGDLNDWIQELASTLTTDLATFGKELFVECKEQALHMKINLPVINLLSLTKKWKNTTLIYSGTFLKKLQVRCYVAINHSH